MSNVIPNLYVVGMGLGVVFVGLISIIILCYIVSAICRAAGGNDTADAKQVPVQTAAPTASPIQNRQEVIAAVAAAAAEDMGTDISAIRILSFKKI